MQSFVADAISKDRSSRRPTTAAGISRRTLLKQSAAFTAMACVPAPLHGALSGHKVFAYVGTYNGAGEHGKGILLCEMNSRTGELTFIKVASTSTNACWLAFDASGKYLYAANDVDNFAGHSGSVTAFSINRATGDLQVLNVVSSEGVGPAHLSLDASGRYVFVANYPGGSIAVLPILANGALGPAVYKHSDAGAVGPVHAADAPGGSFAISGHDAPHPHMIAADPGNHFVLQTDLGQDRIYVFAFDQTSGKLTPRVDQPFTPLPAGDGPRHFAFHPNGQWLYSLQEESSTIVFFHFDAATGKLRAEQTLSTLPAGFHGTSFAAEILLSPDRRFLYTTNRLHDTIAVFSLDGQGRLKYAGECSTRGDYPRHMQIAPGGDFMYACNQHSDSVTSFKIDKKTGLLTFTGQYLPAGGAACIVFLP